MRFTYLLCALCLIGALPAHASREQANLDQRYLAGLPPAPASVFDKQMQASLAALALNCIDVPDLNFSGGGQYLWIQKNRPQLLEDYASKRAFWGCADWHSAVNMTWALVMLERYDPRLWLAPLIDDVLGDHLGQSNLDGELKFFKSQMKHGEEGFEVPYGWVWLLKLQDTLSQWQSPAGQKYGKRLQPFAAFLAKAYATSLNELTYPVRWGMHYNTSFTMLLAWDYAAHSPDYELHDTIVRDATRMYLHDRACPTTYEPSGQGGDFVSPCLTEAALMSKILPQQAFLAWLGAFLPPVYAASFQGYARQVDTTVRVPPGDKHPTIFQRSAGSHLTGLTFQRAAMMMIIAHALPAGDPRVPVFERLAELSAHQGFVHMWRTGFAGSHFLASYALLYEESARPSWPSGAQ